MDYRNIKYLFSKASFYLRKILNACDWCTFTLISTVCIVRSLGKFDSRADRNAGKCSNNVELSLWVLLCQGRDRRRGQGR